MTTAAYFNAKLREPELQALLDNLVEQRTKADEIRMRADPIAQAIFDRFDFQVGHWDDLYLEDDDEKCDDFYRQVDAVYREAGLISDSQVWGTWPQGVEEHAAITLEGDVLNYFGPEFYRARLDLRAAFIATLIAAREVWK